MQVTTEMIHEDLRPFVKPLGILGLMLKNRTTVQVSNKVADLALAGRDIKGLTCQEIGILSSDGAHVIRTRIYRPTDHLGPLPAMLYIHGGGYVSGNPEMSAPVIKSFIDKRPCVIVAPAYRLAYDAPFPAGFDDCYDALLWTRANIEKLGVASERLIVAGHSAGGGLTAAVTLKARDTGDVDVAFQMPFYPMIDDTQPDDPERKIDSPVWNTETNRMGWGAYLAGLRRTGAEIPAYAAPARNTEWAGMPPTITFIGTLDPFHSETTAYVAALRDAGVEVAFTEYEGCFHGFETVLPKTDVGKDGQAFTVDTYADFYDRYAS